MSELLYDYIVRTGNITSLPWAFINSNSLTKSICIKADNVYEYVISNNDKIKQQIGSLPNPVPPFQNCFIEFKPKGLVGILKVGIHTTSIDRKDIKHREFFKWLNSIENENIEKLQNDTKTIFIFHLFLLSTKGELSFSKAALIVFYDEFYKIITGYTYGNNPDIPTIAPQSLVCLYTFSLINCKNISLIKHIPPKNIQKKRIRRGELPLVEYRILSIDGSSIVKTVGQLDDKNIRDKIMPLHITRGNFAIYDTKGLFGKYFGTFWRPQHLKGLQENGTIIKDYDVQIREKNYVQ